MEREAPVHPPSNKKGKKTFSAEEFDKALIAWRRFFVKYNQPILSGRTGRHLNTRK
jgi:hypothetical protein